jgi:hypothetical protein
MGVVTAGFTRIRERTGTNAGKGPANPEAFRSGRGLKTDGEIWRDNCISGVGFVNSIVNLGVIFIT